MSIWYNVAFLHGDLGETYSQILQQITELVRRKEMVVIIYKIVTTSGSAAVPYLRFYPRIYVYSLNPYLLLSLTLLTIAQPDTALPHIFDGLLMRFLGGIEKIFNVLQLALDLVRYCLVLSP